jgi:hypothetical protein
VQLDPADPLLQVISRSHLLVPLLFFAAVGILHPIGWFVGALADLAVSSMRSLARVRAEYQALFKSSKVTPHG